MSREDQMLHDTDSDEFFSIDQRQLYHWIGATVGQSNILTIPRVLIAYFDEDLVSALFFSQLIYWSNKKDGDCWIAKSYKEWREELSLNKNWVRHAVKKCKEKGLLETKTKKWNGAPTVHYRVLGNRFIQELFPFMKAYSEKARKSDFPDQEKGKEGSGESTFRIRKIEGPEEENPLSSSGESIGSREENPSSGTGHSIVHPMDNPSSRQKKSIVRHAEEPLTEITSDPTSKSTPKETVGGLPAAGRESGKASGKGTTESSQRDGSEGSAVRGGRSSGGVRVDDLAAKALRMRNGEDEEPGRPKGRKRWFAVEERTVTEFIRAFDREAGPEFPRLLENRPDAVDGASPGIRRKVKHCLAEHPLEWWVESFRALKRIPFLKRRDKEGWRPTFMWMISRDKDSVLNAYRVVEWASSSGHGDTKGGRGIEEFLRERGFDPKKAMERVYGGAGDAKT